MIDSPLLKRKVSGSIPASLAPIRINSLAIQNSYATRDTEILNSAVFVEKLIQDEI